MRPQAARWAIVTQAHARPHQLVFEELARRLGPAVLLCGRRVGDATPELEVRLGPPYVKGALPVRAASWLRFAGWAAGQLLRIRPRFVLVVTNPPIFPHVAWFIRQLRCQRMRFGVLVWDVYPRVITEAGVVGRQHPVARLWRLGNKIAYSSAEFVVTLSAQMARALAEEGVPSGKVSVFPNWTDTHWLRPVPKAENTFLERLALADSFVVAYSGNIGEGHSFQGIVEAAEILSVRAGDGGRKPAFLFVGEGLGARPLRAAVEARNLDNFFFLPPQPDSIFPQVASAGDLAVVSLRPGFEATSMPSKLYTAMAAGRPILALCSPDSELARFVLENEIGWAVPAEDGPAIAEIIEWAQANPGRLRDMGVQARALAERDYSVESAVRFFEGLLRSVLTP